MNHDLHAPLREQLSALMDGELPADQARFLLRRIEHDRALSGDLERWQRIGDALRGDAQAGAPAGFAEAVAARIAYGEHALPAVDALPAAQPMSKPPAKTPRHPGWRWFGGGALAASLAMASWMGLRTQPVTGPAPAQPRAEAASPFVLPVITEVAPPAVASDAAKPASNTAMAKPNHAPAARVQLASREARPAPARERGGASLPRMRNAAASSSPAAAPENAQIASSETRQKSNPFRPQAEEPAPAWPRAILPEARGSVFNASLDANVMPFRQHVESASANPLN